jgi:hypothetical protein
MQNGFEDRAWCINSIGINEITLVLAGTWLNDNEGIIVNITKKM